MENTGEGVNSWLVMFTALLGGFVVVLGLLKKANEWYYESKLGEKRLSLPPGDMGWPFIGNMCSFLRAFKSNDPESFINGFVKRFGRIGMYKAFMFGNPTIMVTIPETCRQVLMDDEKFKPGWPQSTVELIGRKSFVGLSYEDHKWLRRITAAPVNGHEALSVYLEFIEENVASTLERWSNMGEIEFLTQLRKLTFRIIMHIFISKGGESVMDALEEVYTTLNYGVRAMAINLPGFAYYRALKSRKRLVEIFLSVVNERRAVRVRDGPPAKKDMLDNLLDVKDENGRKLNDEEIIDTLIMYLNAGHESSGHITMWATVLLQEHPDMFQKAKAEQEQIVKNIPSMQKGLRLKEIKQMDYLNKVTSFPWAGKLRFGSGMFTVASRWDGFTQKAGTYLPFGAGSRLCPGNELAKLEIAIFMHYFLLNYRVERLNPKCSVMYLPHTRHTDNCLARIRKISPPSM
ncbi:hypothetical protein IFM89_025440 [Coptis chinensis]|uniref:Cytochrome P450 n=1 Tax=Coptis chinensis TaxID=261450 RepID=A0A835LRG9_9MAGN|nr:hypothetical protein IFM89_025440 [Coptis chinensis]